MFQMSPIKKTLAHWGAALLLPRSESRWHVLPPHSVLVLQRESADAGAGTNNADSSSISTKLSRLTASATARQGRLLAAGSRFAAIFLKVRRNAGVLRSRVCAWCAWTAALSLELLEAADLKGRCNLR